MAVLRLVTGGNLVHWRNQRFDIQRGWLEDSASNVRLRVADLRGVLDLYEHLMRDGVRDLEIRRSGFQYDSIGSKFREYMYVTTPRLGGYRRGSDGVFLDVYVYKNYLSVAASKEIEQQLVQAKTYGITYTSILSVFLNYQVD